MHRLIMAAGILAMLTLAAAGAALAWYSHTNAEDAGFLRDYLMQRAPAERAQIRDFAAATGSRGVMADNALRDYLVNEELRRRLAELEDTQLADRLVLSQFADPPLQRIEAEQAALDRAASRRDLLESARLEADRRVRDADATRERAEKQLREWNDKVASERLNQLVADLDKSREPELLLPQLQFLPLSDLYYVLTRARNMDNRAQIIAMLPPESQRALAQYGANPAGLARAP